MADHRCYQPVTKDRKLNSVYCLVFVIIHKHRQESFQGWKAQPWLKKLKLLTCTAWLGLIRRNRVADSEASPLLWMNLFMNREDERWAAGQIHPKVNCPYWWSMKYHFNGHPFSHETIASMVQPHLLRISLDEAQEQDQQDGDNTTNSIYTTATTVTRPGHTAHAKGPAEW